MKEIGCNQNPLIEIWSDIIFRRSNFTTNNREQNMSSMLCPRAWGDFLTVTLFFNCRECQSGRWVVSSGRGNLTLLSKPASSGCVHVHTLFFFFLHFFVFFIYFAFSSSDLRLLSVSAHKITTTIQYTCVLFPVHALFILFWEVKMQNGKLLKIVLLSLHGLPSLHLAQCFHL